MRDMKREVVINIRVTKDTDLILKRLAIASGKSRIATVECFVEYMINHKNEAQRCLHLSDKEMQLIFDTGNSDT